MLARAGYLEGSWACYLDGAGRQGSGAGGAPGGDPMLLDVGSEEEDGAGGGDQDDEDDDEEEEDEDEDDWETPRLGLQVWGLATGTQLCLESSNSTKLSDESNELCACGGDALG